ncbi:glycoside hydrolase family protein [Paenibacillus sonchi]|uniref:hypothetical protein n=1 Tax=Paenibacillus sonchi TaxID=373687 RepID=UPI001F35781F|nr:hypothetical protein [Paenibacillus sonchi]
MVKKRFRYLLVCLAVLLMLPQWSGPAVAAEPMPSTPDSAPLWEGKNVADFYNVIMQVGADPWVYKHTDGYYYNVFVNASGIMIRRAKTISGIDAGERSLAWTPVNGTMYSSNVWALKCTMSKIPMANSNGIFTSRLITEPTPTTACTCWRTPMKIR